MFRPSSGGLGQNLIGLRLASLSFFPHPNVSCPHQRHTAASPFGTTSLGQGPIAPPQQSAYVSTMSLITSANPHTSNPLQQPIFLEASNSQFASTPLRNANLPTSKTTHNQQMRIENTSFHLFPSFFHDVFNQPSSQFIPKFDTNGTDHKFDQVAMLIKIKLMPTNVNQLKLSSANCSQFFLNFLVSILYKQSRFVHLRDII